MSRSSKTVRGKRKPETKTARKAVKRRAVPERMRSDRGVEEMTHSAGEYGIRGGENEKLQAPHPAPVATSAASNINERRPDAVMQATASALAAVQAWFVLPLRTLQCWQQAWVRLVPR